MNRLYILVFLLSVFLVFTTCRKEDVTPHYEYIGGAGTVTPETEEDTEAVQIEEGEFQEGEGLISVSYTEVDLGDCYLPMGGEMSMSGFVDSEPDLINKFSQWCPTFNIPNIDFDKQFVAYYAGVFSGCTDARLKGVYREGNQGIRVDIARADVPLDCVCTKELWRLQYFLIIDRMDTVAHRFNEIAVEKPCD